MSWYVLRKAHQFASARPGSWGRAKAVQIAEGSETQPQMMNIQRHWNVSLLRVECLVHVVHDAPQIAGNHWGVKNSETCTYTCET